ncbi:hypothetical protein ACN000_29885, partial [Klebsiella pneumoniae]|uniref:hypothetical protein n=1 Tax=Klebsiella pneumoniae TaxID=573 RepID=UPI003AEAAD36
MGSCAAPSAKGDDKFITTDYLQQCRLKRLSKMISDLLPPVDLTELLLEINAHTGFADEFFHASEASA